ncbi:MAG: LTA synthase family protein [Lachnoclostridium edouardi]|uniref:LTA synthase family protein n=1 Tax=Lachnoclostridium edouardi TaxID=1926283 RepID=UPI0026DBB353|nr:LTA synthase family protein [Lachnoclostridium edouardi]MDO4278213.1 LTA synthase family protein [Lachnoclostridium edouardi]
MENKRRLTGKIVFWFTPAAACLLVEILGHGGLPQIKMLFLNMVFFYMLYLVTYAVFNNEKIVYPFWNTAFFILALAEYYVLQFRDRPIMLGDFLAVKTAASVSGNYSYEINIKIILAAAVVVALSVLAVKFPVKMRGKRARWLMVPVSVAAFTLFLTGFYQVLIKQWGIEINMWNPRSSYESNGYAVCTFRSFAYLFEKAPDGYSVEAVRQDMETVEQNRENAAYYWQTDTEIIPENIICIMNESFSDLSQVGDFKTDQPYLSFYNELEENCVKGNLYMPVWGSMTSNSEYEFLTGNSISFISAGAVPFQIYMEAPVYGLPLTLKAQGYKTIGMHPYPASNWNRNSAYKAMGFDEFLAEEYFLDSERIRGYVSDRGTYKKIMELTEEKEKGDKLFIFDVTMQNHGGYWEEYQTQVHIEGGDFPMAEQYLSLIRESDQALKELLEYYENVEEPTMIIMFGDHQPSIEESFYEMLYGCSMGEVEKEDYLRRYVTPFLVWTNYETPSEKIDKISAMYLSNIIVERANLLPTSYQVFLDEMYQKLPVVHPLGYYKSDGSWFTWDGWKEKEEYEQWWKPYENFLYNNIFGRKNRINEFFSISMQQ